MSKLSENLLFLHQTMQALQPNLARIAVALYDQNSGLISTYASSIEDDNPLLWYSYPLENCPSLKQLADSGKSRIIDDMRQFSENQTVHSDRLLAANYRSSFTLPIRQNDQLLGFIFFNSTLIGDFSEHLIPQLEISAYAISLLVTQETSQIQTLKATLKTAVAVTHERDPETGEHLRRMTDYSRFACSILGPRLKLSDLYTNHLVLFSSLHDIGKISIRDDILLKPGRLTADEYEIMKGHTTSGLKIIDSLIENHALNHLDHIEMLRNIIGSHHENWDGTGYPDQIAGEDIPLEARILAVCDAFDAITTERPYKSQLDTPAALKIIEGMRGTKLDPMCADLFIQHPEQLDAIRQEHKINGLV